jgi:hypothetical protein
MHRPDFGKPVPGSQSRGSVCTIQIRSIEVILGSDPDQREQRSAPRR